MSSARTQLEVSPRELAELMAAFARELMGEGQQEFLRTLEENQLSFTQVKLLMCVSGRVADGVSVGACADTLGLSAAGTSRAVESLATRGLLERREDPEDRRSRLISLTSDGTALVDRLQELRIAGFTRSARRLDPQLRAAFATTLTQVVDGLAKGRESE